MNWTDVFISHSSKDSAFAEQVVSLLAECIDFGAGEVVCTSAEGYGLEFGTKFEKKLRKSIEAAEVVVALVSPNSLESLFCTFEMGAAWGMKKPLKPILLPGVQKSAIQRPLASLHFLEWGNEAGWVQFVEEVAKTTDSEVRAKPARVLALARRTSAYGVDLTIGSRYPSP